MGVRLSLLYPFGTPDDRFAVPYGAIVQPRPQRSGSQMSSSRFGWDCLYGRG